MLKYFQYCGAVSANVNVLARFSFILGFLFVYYRIHSRNWSRSNPRLLIVLRPIKSKQQRTSIIQNNNPNWLRSQFTSQLTTRVSKWSMWIPADVWSIIFYSFTNFWFSAKVWNERAWKISSPELFSLSFSNCAHEHFITFYIHSIELKLLFYYFCLFVLYCTHPRPLRLLQIWGKKKKITLYMTFI